MKFIRRFWEELKAPVKLTDKEKTLNEGFTRLHNRLPFSINSPGDKVVDMINIFNHILDRLDEIDG